MNIQGSKGFTLLEILVVIFVIAVFTTSVMLATGLTPKDTRLRDQAQRLVALIELAQEEALIQGRDLGLRIEPQAYEFYVFDELRQQWQAVPADDVLKPRGLEDDMRFYLMVEGREVVLGAEREEQRSDNSRQDPGADGQTQAQAVIPQIMLLGSGDLVPFELTLEGELSDEGFTLIGEADGTVRLEGQDDTEG